MGQFATVYNDGQRLAIALAYDPPRVSSARVSELAAAGRLVDVDGRRVEPFAVPAGTVRSIAQRTRRNGVGEDAGVDPAALRKLYARLSTRVAKKLAAARTPKEIAEAARAALEVERLSERVAKMPAPSVKPKLGASVLKAHRAGPVYVHPPPPVVVPEPKPEPKPEPPETPGEWMRRALASIPQEAEPAAVVSVAHGEEDTSACEATGHVGHRAGRGRGR